MSHPFEMWADRIAAADSEPARRELLSEAARWRAQHLGDVPAMRRATFAISQIHTLLGDRDRAVSEARQLLSLCQTAPAASSDEIEAARGYLSSLGEHAPRITADRAANGRVARTGRDRSDRMDGGRMDGGRMDRMDRGDRPDRSDRRRPDADRLGERARTEPRDDRGGSLVDARKAAARSDWNQALALLDGAKGAGATVLRAYIQLSVALGAEDPRPGIEAVRTELARSAGLPTRSGGQGSTSDGTDPLSQLLGAPVPDKRMAKIRAIEQFAVDHPERIDELASTALRQHVGSSGPGAPAPWLVGIAATALATGSAPLTTSAIADLRASGAVAVQPYDEWAFERLLRLMIRAGAVGATPTGLRRGVLARGEPDDRKLWTLRLRVNGEERMMAVAPHASTAYPDGKAEELSERLVALCPRTVLLATGSGNAALRASAATAGLTVREHDADDEALLAALGDTVAAPSIPRPERTVSITGGSITGGSITGRAPRAERTGADGRGDVDAALGSSHPSPPDRLAELLQVEPPDVTALTEVLRTFRRPDRALRAIQRIPLDDARTAAVLRAVDAATEPGRAIPEATTLAIRTAAHGPLTRALLVDGGPVTERFSGPHAGAVIDVARTLLDGGWEVHRVLRGPTRRETTAHPALETLSGSMSGLWRLLVRRDDRKGEVWYLAELPPEGRAGIPLLLLEDWQRVVVLPVEPELLGWWRTLGGPEAVGWTGSESDALLGAVDAFVVRAEPASSHEEAAAAP
ncbi:MAG: hypothetical protein ABMB14_00955 [Myxococcota bacterium]